LKVSRKYRRIKRININEKAVVKRKMSDKKPVEICEHKIKCETKTKFYDGDEIYEKKSQPR
jgi:hypothetical protein